METLYITPKSAAERLKVIKALEAVGITPKVLSREQQENAGLYLAMQEGKKTEQVSRETIMKTLGMEWK